MGEVTIKSVIEQLEEEYKTEDLHYEETIYGIGFRFKGKWYNLSDYNFLAQLDIVTSNLKTLLR